MSELQTIDVTPSWETAARIYAEVARSGTTEQSQTMAQEEIVRMGLTLDALLAFVDHEELKKPAREWVTGYFQGKEFVRGT